MRPHQPTPTPHMKGDNRRQRETKPLQSPRRRPHQPTPTPHIKGDNRRQWETRPLQSPRSRTTRTNTKAARSKVALRTPTVKCLGKNSQVPLVVATCTAAAATGTSGKFLAQEPKRWLPATDFHLYTGFSPFSNLWLLLNAFHNVCVLTLRVFHTETSPRHHAPAPTFPGHWSIANEAQHVQVECATCRAMAPSSEMDLMLGTQIAKLKTRDPKILRTNASFPWCQTSDFCLREWVLGWNMPRAKSRILVELPKRTNAAMPRSSLEGMKDQNSNTQYENESLELCIQRHATDRNHSNHHTLPLWHHKGN